MRHTPSRMSPGRGPRRRWHSWSFEAQQDKAGQSRASRHAQTARPVLASALSASLPLRPRCWSPYRRSSASLKKYRDKVYISSKTQARDGKAALADLETSLKELQTDHLDVWHLHSRSTPDMVTDDVLEAQRSAKQAGKIRFAG